MSKRIRSFSASKTNDEYLDTIGWGNKSDMINRAIDKVRIESTGSAKSEPVTGEPPPSEEGMSAGAPGTPKSDPKGNLTDQYLEGGSDGTEDTGGRTGVRQGEPGASAEVGSPAPPGGSYKELASPDFRDGLVRVSTGPAPNPTNGELDTSRTQSRKPRNSTGSGRTSKNSDPPSSETGSTVIPGLRHSLGRRPATRP